MDKKNDREIMISVALCTYNGEHYIHEQLESILNQTMPVDEIVVCDDGSSDITLQIIESLNKSTQTDIRIYRNEKNLGPALNFQKAINLCLGDIIFLSDQDDVWEPYKVESIISYFNVNKSIQVVFTDALLIDLSGNSNTIIPNNLWSYHFRKKDKKIFDYGIQLEPFLNGRNHATGATMAFRKNIVQNRPLTNICQHGEVLHDYALAIYAAENKTLGYIENSLIRYRIHDGQTCGLIRRKSTVDYQIYLINTCIIPYLQNPNAIEIAEFTKFRLQQTRKVLGVFEIFRYFLKYKFLYDRMAIRILCSDISAWSKTIIGRILLHPHSQS